MKKQRLLIASTSTVYGSGYLEYLKHTIVKFFKGIDEIVFIPFARPGGISYEEYASIAATFFDALGIKTKGIHECSNMQGALLKARGIFTGGGNTFLLLKALYDFDILNLLRKVLINGTPYLGTSAGSNILGISIKTTNDMPIVYPPSFDALGVVPFNINPHYIDADKNSTHMGETREIRIREFLKFNKEVVVGLKEGGYLLVEDKRIVLGGNRPMKIFSNKEMLEKSPGSNIDFLLN